MLGLPSALSQSPSWAQGTKGCCWENPRIGRWLPSNSQTATFLVIYDLFMWIWWGNPFYYPPVIQHWLQTPLKKERWFPSSKAPLFVGIFLPWQDTSRKNEGSSRHPQASQGTRSRVDPWSLSNPSSSSPSEAQRMAWKAQLKNSQVVQLVFLFLGMQKEWIPPDYPIVSYHYPSIGGE